MALFHLNVDQVKRSEGSSVIASAAYRAGEKLYSEYDGVISDYTRKGGVLYSEIMLPSYAPPEYKDRQTLWNAVEKVEKNRDAQLAYSFDVALQYELTFEENKEVARAFLQKYFVGKGMVVDMAIHDPDKEEGNPNPHFHILAPIRPIEENGKWGFKQHRVYSLDENGERIRDENGKYVYNSEATTDWGEPETLDMWREKWAEMVNAKFEEKGLDCRIDNRSYEAQGIDLIPSVHEGVSVRQMEAKGIKTEKGELNRWIKATNAQMKKIRQTIKGILSWIKEIREEINAPREPDLARLMGDYLTERNSSAWSAKAKKGNLQKYINAMNYLSEKGLTTLTELEAHVRELSAKLDGITAALNGKSSRIKDLKEMIRYSEMYEECKPAFKEMQTIKFKKAKEEYKEKHYGDISRYQVSRRKLKEYMGEDGKYQPSEWKKELDKLQSEYQEKSEERKPLRDEMEILRQVKYNVDRVLREKYQVESREPKAKKQNMEL